MVSTLRQTVISAFLLIGGLLILPAQLEAKKQFIEGYDGTQLCVEEHGNPKGMPILFIHGIAQSKEAWINQVTCPELQSYRLITIDLRGHGESEKPMSDYWTRDLWARDLHSVIEQLDLHELLIVGWSYGGLVLLDYIHNFGTDRLAGINLVSACTKYQIPIDIEISSDGETFILEEFASEIAANRERATYLFSKLFSKHPLPHDTFHSLLKASSLVPFYVLRGMMERSFTNDQLIAEIQLPILASYGDEDRVVSYLNESLDLFPNLQLDLYPECGHMPFCENADRYNAALCAFANRLFSSRDRLEN